MAATTPMSVRNTPRLLPYDWPNRDCSEMIETAGGRWHVQRAGSGPTVLLLHGTAASTHTWRDFIEPLSAHYDVIAVDLPGHAYTDRALAATMSLDAIRNSLCELFGKLGIEPVHVVGHSAGAAIALDLVLRANLRPVSVTGINAALLPFGGVLRGLFSPMARFFASTQAMPSLLARRARDRAAVQRVLRGTGSMLDDEGLALYQTLFRREEHLASVLTMMAAWHLDPMLARLPSLSTPLSLIVGERDLAVRPSEAVKVGSVVRHARIHRLPSVGHLAHEEQPQQVVDLLLQQFAKSEAPIAVVT